MLVCSYRFQTQTPSAHVPFRSRVQAKVPLQEVENECLWNETGKFTQLPC